MYFLGRIILVDEEVKDNRFDLLLIFAPNGYAWASVPIILIMSGILILTGIILFAVGVKNNEK